MTVAVLPVVHSDIQKVNERDLEWTAVRGSGAGGQARNKTSNAVQMTHLPTGLTVRVETDRSQHVNRETARRILAARIAASAVDRERSVQDRNRRQQVGSGMRGDKIRTVRLQDDIVVDHRTGKRMKASRYRQGFLDELR